MGQKQKEHEKIALLSLFFSRSLRHLTNKIQKRTATNNHKRPQTNIKLTATNNYKQPQTSTNNHKTYSHKQLQATMNIYNASLKNHVNYNHYIHIYSRYLLTCQEAINFTYENKLIYLMATSLGLLNLPSKPSKSI
jgi:hypothetical protein